MVVALTILFCIICILIIAAVLIQPHEEEGMGGIFGASGPESFFGGKGNITMIKVTAVLGILYFIIAISVHKINERRLSKEPAEKTKVEKKAPKQSKAPVIPLKKEQK
jgi:protein translocase SecG subunit